MAHNLMCQIQKGLFIRTYREVRFLAGPPPLILKISAALMHGRKRRLHYFPRRYDAKRTISPHLHSYSLMRAMRSEKIVTLSVQGDLSKILPQASHSCIGSGLRWLPPCVIFSEISPNHPLAGLK